MSSAITRVAWAVLSLALSGCVELRAVRVSNQSSHAVSVRADFARAGKHSDCVDFQLAPGGREMWNYTSQGEPNTHLDPELQRMTLSIDGHCTLIWSRERIEAAASRPGLWEITLNDENLKCSLVDVAP